MKLKYRLLATPLSLICCAALIGTASGQLTWTPTTSLWDTVSPNWNGGAANVVWDNTGNQEALFPAGGTVDIADGGVTVGDLTTQELLTLQSVTDNLGLITIAAGGATWNTSGNEIEFANNNLVGPLVDTPLAMTAGDTLTIMGGGVFDTGERPAGADWTVNGAFLRIAEPTTVRGNAGSVGQFDSVGLVDGSLYIHERNSGQTYPNNWQLGAGTIQFGNQFSRQMSFTGVVSGDGTVEVVAMAGSFLALRNTDNTFTGGVVVDSTLSRSELQVGDDGGLGAVPATVDPDNILLRSGGELKLVNASLDANRGITLDGGGIIVASGSPSTYDGTITGTGSLQVGREAGADGNALILSSDTHDYTGDTQIYQGRLILGIDEALHAGTNLTIGGKGTSLFVLNGFTQTLTGLGIAANNTRQIINYDAVTSPSIPTQAGTLILDITDDAAVDQEVEFGSIIGLDATADSGNLNIIKNGTGTARLDRVTVAGSVEVNDGTLRLGNSSETTVVGDLTNDASLLIDESFTAASLTAGADSDTTFNWEINDWTGFAGLGFTLLTVDGDATFAPSSELTIVIEEAMLTNFTETNSSFTIGVVRGALTAPGSIAVDASGFTSGAGTWEARVDGGFIILDYTAGVVGAYAIWASGFPTLTGGFTDDDDNDGIANGLEYYFFNSDPTNANNLSNPLCLESSTGDGNLVFSHDRPVDDSDITATYQWSTTLEDANWTPSGTANGGLLVTVTPGTPVAASAGYETISVTTASTPATAETIFVRLAVSQP